MTTEELLCNRREPRFKTSDDQPLQCNTKIDEENFIEGAVIDISSGGLRLLCEGSFTVGQTFLTELQTDRSHGSFRGVIRRVEPWKGGQAILGCQLIDRIPAAALERLAQEGSVNRRRDDRVHWAQPAKISWELQAGDVDIEVQDCSPGGLKISSPTAIPDDLRLRICIDMGDDEQLLVDAKSVWQHPQPEGVIAGLAFTKKDVPDAVRRILEMDDPREQLAAIEKRRSLLRRGGLAVAGIFVLGVALWQAGVWG